MVVVVVMVTEWTMNIKQAKTVNRLCFRSVYNINMKSQSLSPLSLDLSICLFINLCVCACACVYLCKLRYSIRKKRKMQNKLDIEKEDKKIHTLRMPSPHSEPVHTLITSHAETLAEREKQRLKSNKQD